MRIVVVGGTGLVGTKVVRKLGEYGHDVVATASSNGVDAVTGEGLSAALTGATVVVDASNSASSLLLKSEEDAGVSHHVALSIVGTDRVHGGSFGAQSDNDELIAAGPIPYTIVRTTPFFESLRTIADAATVGTMVRVPPVWIQPVAAADVAEAVAIAAVGAPMQGIAEIAGPERFLLDELLRMELTAHGDPRTVVSDPDARYLGSTVIGDALMPGPDATVFDIRVADWILETAAKRWHGTN